MLNHLKISKAGFGLFLALACFASRGVHGQDLELPKILPRAAQYVLGNEDEVLIKVNLLGYVQKPGQYLVPRYTDLLSLISFAGGVQPGANLSHVQIMRAPKAANGTDGTNGAEAKHDILTVNLKKYFDTGQTRYVPVLEAGDSVLIKRSTGDKLRNLLGVNSIVSLMAATATLIYALDRL